MRKMRVTIHQAVRGFVGICEKNGLAHHTLRSYRSDLRTFERFCDESSLSLSGLNAGAIKAYRSHLVRARLKKNTLRRKILTLQQFLEFLRAQKWLRFEPLNLSVPAKILRVPYQVNLHDLKNRLAERPMDRSTLMLWIVLETGIRTSELIRLRREDFNSEKLKITGKYFRVVSVSSDLCAAIARLETGFLFAGHNRFGPISDRMTERGAEMTIKALGKTLAVDALTARVIRHSLIADWLRDGMSRADILQRLGLRSETVFQRFISNY